jgi:hemolysin D
MVVVPEGSKLQIEAMLPNRDVGFVHPGQPAEVKVEAFTYTRYGLLHGTVDGVSRDTITNGNGGKSGGNNGNQQQDSRDPDAADGQHAESAYVARISLAQAAIDTEDGLRPLEPGMTVTAEIKTGRRRVIEYLISPLLRYRHEGLRER